MNVNGLNYQVDSLRVTVLMPAFNAAATIEEAIKSLQKQTGIGWTLLVIDDGSTDRTAEIVRSFGSADPRILLLQRDRAGLCSALNAGLDAAQTEAVARLDADDLWSPRHLERQLAFWSRLPEVRVLGTWGSRINAGGERLSQLIVGPSTLAEFDEQMGKGTPIYLIHSSVLALRRTLLDHGGYRDSDHPAEDIHLWTRIAQSGPVLAIPEDLTSYRVTGQGVSARLFKLQAIQTERLKHRLKTGRVLELDEFRDYMRRRPVESLQFEAATCQRYWFRKGAAYACNGNRLKGSAYVALSAALNPSLVLRRIWFSV